MISREDWLKEATKIIERDILSKHQTMLPENWTVSVGFCSNPKAIGQAWDKKASVDEKTHQMFISPVLGKHDKVNLLQVLLHESIHISVGVDQKHGGEFKRVARAAGLEGRLTATYVTETNPLYATLQNIYEETKRITGCDYPHEEITLKVKEKKARKSNIIKLVSENDPAYIVKIKKDLIESAGVPVDPWGEKMKPLEEDE